ncbi:MAG TPA: putative sugar nucleotidyl transferase [Gemmatimonadales bacterium]
MTRVYLLEPELGPAWYPFGDCRPICELRAGIWLIRERWEAVAEGETAAVFGPEHLRSFVEPGAPAVRARTAVEGPAILGRSDFAPSGEPPELGPGPARLINDGVTVGWWVPEGHRWEEHATDGAAVELAGLPLHGAYDLITALEHFLQPDAADFTNERGDGVPDGCTVIGDPGDVVILGGQVEPGVVFDVRDGVVVIEQGARVAAGARLEGPVFVGPGSEVLGDTVRWCVIGPRCKVRGEVTTSVFGGYANKAHYGFVGHSAVGHWVNLGAGTTTSNLKNTYGSVRVRVGQELVDTARQFLGSLVGDHAKTAIGTLLETGTVVGCGANVFGPVRPPKQVAPFAWGDTSQRVTRDAFLTVARRVLPRRGVEVTPEIEAMLGAIHDRGTTGNVGGDQLTGSA